MSFYLAQCGTAGDESAGAVDRLFRSYLDDGGDGQTVTISGLSQWLATEGVTNYKVTVYMNSDDAGNTFAEFNFYDGTGTGGTLLETMSPTTGDGSGNGAARLTYTTMNLTNDVITLQTDRELGVGGQRAGISGFLIEAIAVPEPSSSIFLCLGGFVLVWSRRRK